MLLIFPESLQVKEVSTRNNTAVIATETVSLSFFLQPHHFYFPKFSLQASKPVPFTRESVQSIVDDAVNRKVMNWWVKFYDVRLISEFLLQITEVTFRPFKCPNINCVCCAHWKSQRDNAFKGLCNDSYRGNQFFRGGIRGGRSYFRRGFPNSRGHFHQNV